MIKLTPYKTMFYGAGSIMSLYEMPVLRERAAYVTDPEEMVRHAWEQTGQSMWKALGEYEKTPEQKDPETSTSRIRSD